MTPDQEQAYERLSDMERLLYSSPKAARFNRVLLQEFIISDEKADAFIDSIGDVILHIKSQNQLETELIENFAFTQETYNLFRTKFLNYLDTKEKTSSPIHLSKTNETLKNLEQKVTVQPIRTMADDMEKVHGYGAYRTAEETPSDIPTEEIVHQSTQDAVIPNKPSLAAAPTYAPAPVAETPATQPDEPEQDTRWQPSLSQSS